MKKLTVPFRGLKQKTCPLFFCYGCVILDQKVSLWENANNFTPEQYRIKYHDREAAP